jgi:protein-L-isoaspartate(D-aspartate) O-methyltransferase
MSQMNVAQARFNMIQQQIRPWEVLDERVLDLIDGLPREEFVPTAFRNLAFADINIPLAHEQVMMAPKLEGRVLQSLQVKPTDTVLEIGTGSGFLTALLAKCAKYVYTVDLYDEFAKTAQTLLGKLNISNVQYGVGNAIEGWKALPRYDVIVLTGSVPVLKPHFQEQLNIGGRLFVVKGEDPVMEAILITRISEQQWAVESLFETSIPTLVGAPTPKRFSL